MDRDIDEEEEFGDYHQSISITVNASSMRFVPNLLIILMLSIVCALGERVVVEGSGSSNSSGNSRSSRQTKRAFHSITVATLGTSMTTSAAAATKTTTPSTKVSGRRRMSEEMSRMSRSSSSGRRRPPPTNNDDDCTCEAVKEEVAADPLLIPASGEMAAQWLLRMRRTVGEFTANTQEQEFR